MVSKSKIINAIAIPGLLVLICPAVAVNASKTVPIVVRVAEPDPNIPPNWSKSEKEQAFGQMQLDLEKAIKDYYGTFWDVVPDHTFKTKVTVTLDFIRKGLEGDQSYWFRLTMLIRREWTNGKVTDLTYPLAPEAIWYEPTRGNPVRLNPVNLPIAFQLFLDREFPNDSGIKEKSLKRFMERTPVAVDARWAGSGTDTWLLPFPNAPRWEIFEHRTFKLCTPLWNHSCENLIAIAMGERLDKIQDPNEPVKSMLDSAPDPFNVNEYKGAFIYMSPEHFDIDTF